MLSKYDIRFRSELNKLYGKSLQQSTGSVKYQSYAGTVREFMIEITGFLLLYWVAANSLFSIGQTLH